MEIPRDIKKVTAVVIALGILTVSTTYIWSFFAYQEIETMSRDLNDAERPEEAFQIFLRYLEEENVTMQEGKFDSKIRGEGFESRMKLAGLMLLDVASEGGEVFSAIQKGNNRSKYTAKFYSHCNSREILGSSCEENTGYPFATHYALGWLSLGQTIEGLEILWENETASKSFKNYLKRAEYYDSRLMRTNYDYKPVEIALYSENGLFMVGSHKGDIMIDNRTVNVQRKGYFMHSDVNLSLGTHQIKAGNQSFDLKVAYRKPSLGVNRDEKLQFDETRYYERVILKGGAGRISGELSTENDTEFEIPSERFVEEQSIMNTTHFKPYTVKLVSPEVNRTFRRGRPETDVEVSPIVLYGYGMTIEEYKRTQEIFRRLEKIPFISPPQREI